MRYHAKVTKLKTRHHGYGCIEHFYIIYTHMHNTYIIYSAVPHKKVSTTYK